MGKKHTSRRLFKTGRSSKMILEALEARTLMSVVTDIAAAPVTGDATAVHTPLRRYRTSTLVELLPADSSTDIPSIDASSQTYFQIRKRLQSSTPVITQNALATNWTSDEKSVDLNVYATYAGAGGDAALTYTWSAAATPAGATPSFSVNGNFAARTTHVNFDRAGAYTFSVTVSDGHYTATDSVNVTVDAQGARLAVDPGSTQLTLGGTRQFTAMVFDQFDRPSNLPVTWSSDGVGTIGASGLYQAGQTTGSATVHARSGNLTTDTVLSVANGGPVVVTPASVPGLVTGQSAALSVLGGDDGGEAGLTYTWSVISKPAGYTPNFSINGTNAAKNATAFLFMAGQYTFQVTISDGTQSATSQVNVTAVQTVTAIGVSAAAGTLGTNQSTQLNASAIDQFGIPLAVQPSFTWSKQLGVGAVSAGGVFSAGATAGTATIAAGANGVLGAMILTVAGNAAPTVAAGAAAAINTVTTQSTTLSVLGADDNGEQNLVYTWSAVTVPAGGSPVFSANGTNAAKNAGVSFTRAGTYTLRATISDGALTVTSDVVITVAQTVTAIVVTPGTSGLVLNGTQQFAAQAYDQFGFAVNATYAWSKSSGVGSINAAGVYSAGGAAGAAVITAWANGVGGSANVTVGNSAPVIAGAAAAGSGTVPGQSTTLSVLGNDDGGEGNLTYSWSVVTGPGGAAPTFSVNGSNAAKNATISFAKAGVYVLRATVSDGNSAVTSDVAVTVSQTLAWINVTPGSVGVGVNGTQQFAAGALDQFGAAMAASFTWSKVSGVGSVNAGGMYSAGATGGSAVIRASVGGISGSASVTVSNGAPTIATAAVTSAGTVTGNSVALSVLGADDGGEAGLTYAWSLTAAPAGSNAVFSANGTNAAKNTMVTFNKAGAYTFLVTVSDGGLTTSSSVSLAVAQTLTAVTVTPGSASVGLGGTQAFGASGTDQFGATLTVQPTFTWSMASGVGSVNAAGVYSASAGGSAVVRATSGSVSGTASVTVNNAAPTIVSAAGISGQTNTTVNLSVLGNDDGGAANLLYYWNLTASPAGSSTSISASGTNAAKNTSATFNRAGNYTFLATISDGVNLTYSAVNVTVSAVVSGIAVTPGGVSLSGGGTYQFSAAATDQFGQSMSAPVTWSVDASGPGTINGTGLFTASNSTGTATIRATSGGVSGTAGAAVSATNQAPTIVNAAAASGLTATTLNLSVLGNDDGGAANLLYYWNATAAPAGATVSYSVGSGTNAAKNVTVTFNKVGTYTFLATISDSVNLTYSAVSVTTIQVATGVTVAPGGVSIAGLTSYQFTASVVDQFGGAMTSAPVTWSVDAGGPGTVNTNGLFTATNANGTATIRASSGSVSGVAGATVTAVAPPPANSVTVTTRAISNFTELLITGTTSNDSIVVTQSGNTFSIVANGSTQTVTGVFGDMMIKAGSGGSTITVDTSVRINALVFGGAGRDVIANRANAAYAVVVTIGGGTDVVSGNGVQTNFWADSVDTVNASTAETQGQHVNQISAFYQPWTGDPAAADYVTTTLAGQDLRDPVDGAGVVHYANRSLWGTAPVTADVHQFQIGDCFLMADIETMAAANPGRLESVAADLGDGTYVVRFSRYGRFNYVRVDGDFAGQQAFPGASGNIWSPVIEKAYAFFRISQNSYGSLFGGWMTNVTWDFGWTLMDMVAPTSAASLAQVINTAVAQHMGLSVGTGGSISADAPLIGSHAYALVGYTLQNGVYMFQVRNPWGFDGISDGSDGSDGLVTITWAQFQANFGEVCGAT